MIQGGSGKNFGSLLHSKFNFAGTCQECCSRVPGRVCKDTLIQLADVLVGFLLSSRLNHQCWASQVVHQVVGNAPQTHEAHELALHAAQAARAHHHQVRLDVVCEFCND